MLARASSLRVMKRIRPKETESTTKVPTTKRKVSYSMYMYQKWQRDMDGDCKSVTWLDCETGFEGGRKVVSKLKCTVCKTFVSKITSRRNYSQRWIVGADSIHTSNIRDYVHSDQHVHAMPLLQKEHAAAQGQSCSYAPIAIALSNLPEEEKMKLRKI